MKVNYILLLIPYQFVKNVPNFPCLLDSECDLQKECCGTFVIYETPDGVYQPDIKRNR